MRLPSSRLAIALAFAVVFACQCDDSRKKRGTDAGAIEGGEADAGQTDAGQTDAGQTDAGQTDAGETDAGETDAGETDAGETDAGQTDAGSTARFGRIEGIARTSSSCETLPPPATAVSAAGAATTTDATGHFALEDVPAGDRVLVSWGVGAASNPSAATSSSHLFVPVRPDETTFVAFRTLDGEGGTFEPIAASATSTLENASADWAAVTLSGESLETADGAPFGGSAAVMIYVPSSGIASSSMQSATADLLDFADLPPLEDSDGSLLRAFGAAEIRAYDGSGAPLQLREGKTATYRVIVHGLAPSDVFDVYGFESERGWVKGAASATVIPADGMTFVEFEVPHLGWWAVAARVPNAGCVRGVLKGPGGALANAQLSVVPLDQPGGSTAFSAADGSFCARAPASAAVSIRARYAQDLSEGFRVAAASASGDCRAPSGCVDVGAIEIAPPVEGCAKGRSRSRGSPFEGSVSVRGEIAILNEERRSGCRASISSREIKPGADGSFCLSIGHQTDLVFSAIGCENRALAIEPSSAQACEPAGDGCQDLGDLDFYCGS